jgi:GAF domain-containing protein
VHCSRRVAVKFRGIRVKAGESLAGECFRTREVVVSTDSEEDPRAQREACRLVGARSLILVPIFDNGAIRGVLIIWSATPRDFRGDESQLLELLANVVGGALARAELVERLTDEAVTDELTGLANLRAWYDQLDRALARGRRTGQPLSILILDLDGFKLVNDQQGHNAGDILLKAVSSRWANELRAIAGWHHASTGLAVWDGAEGATTLIARADAGMYEHKRAYAALAS